MRELVDKTLGTCIITSQMSPASLEKKSDEGKKEAKERRKKIQNEKNRK